MKNSIVLLYFVGLLFGAYMFRPESAAGLPPQSLIFPAIVALFLASVLTNAITFAVCKVLGMDLVGVCVGVGFSTSLFTWRGIEFRVGMLPLSDFAIDYFYQESGFRQWMVSALPSLIMIGLGVCLGQLRDPVFDMGATLMLWNYPAYTLVALMALALMASGMMNAITFFNKNCDESPFSVYAYMFILFYMFVGVIMAVSKNMDAIKNFLYAGWGVAC